MVKSHRTHQLSQKVKPKESAASRAADSIARLMASTKLPVVHKTFPAYYSDSDPTWAGYIVKGSLPTSIGRVDVDIMVGAKWRGSLRYTAQWQLWGPGSKPGIKSMIVEGGCEGTTLPVLSKRLRSDLESAVSQINKRVWVQLALSKK